MILNQRTQALRAQVEDLVKDLQSLSAEIGHKDLAAAVGELRNRMTEPFMFVIVGEVKAGKSSFVNALLATDREICAVAPQPMTDTIQQILYAEKEEVIVVNPYLKKILLPVEILRDIAIVDTPYAALTDAKGVAVLRDAAGSGELRVWRDDVRAPGNRIVQKMKLTQADSSADISVELRPASGSAHGMH